MDLNALNRLSYGVYVVSTWDYGRATGCLVNAVMQITAKPPTLAVSVHHNNYTHKCLMETGEFAISVLPQKTDPKIVGIFGFKSGEKIDKFDEIEHEVIGNLPVLAHSCAYMTCEIINTMESDTHTVFLGKVIEAEEMLDETPMTYDYYHRVIRGKSPKNAPTYRGE